MHNALSLKYRPKNFDELIGQDIAVQMLTNAFKNDTLHHAYIFAGKFGSGKTTAARILAAMENNDKGPSLHPDPNGKLCKAIYAGRSLDVKEIDAASNRSIDNIREIRDEIRYAPTDCRKKYIILDEAHSLTGQAAEAALKMIEEPPPHVRFILATTDPQLLIDTIHSRCITIKFFKVNWSTLFQHLRMIADKEGLTCEDNALKIAARSADGSVRNAVQNLQTLINFVGNDDITADAASKALGAIDDVMYFNLVNSVLKKNAPEGMKVIDKILGDGKTSSDMIDGLYSHMRNLMIIKTCKSDLSSFGFSEDDSKRYEHQSSHCGLKLIMEMMKYLVDVNRGISFNLDPQILMEKYLIDSILVKKSMDKAASVK